MAKLSGYEKYIFATQLATTDKGLNNKLRLAFHAFNPNGIVKQYAKLGDRIYQLCDEDKINFGCCLAYPTHSTYTKHLVEATQLSQVSTSKVDHLINMVKNYDIPKVTKFLQEYDAGQHKKLVV